MTKSVANTIVQTDTFAGWIDRTNELATEVRNSVVTTANSANVQFSGANTVGNGFVVGVFGANAFAMMTDGNSDGFIRAIQNGETDSSNSSGNIVFQSVTNFNANVFANNITVDIEGNVVSNGTNFSITTSEDLDVTSSNVVISATEGMSVATPDLVVSGNNVDLNSTYANVSGTDLYVTSNVFVEAANLTIGNGAVSTVTNVATADFNTSSNVDITGSTLNVSAIANFSANVIVNANDFFVDTTTQRVGIGTASPGTIVHVTGPGAQTVTVEGGSANVLIVANSQSNFYGSQNVVIKTAQDKHIKLHANGQTAAAVSAMLAANGNFGIGNTAPAEKLVVAGDVRVTANAIVGDSLDVTDEITANTLTLNANGTLEDSLSVNNSITANTLTLIANGTLQDSLSVNNSISANTLTLTSNASLVDATANNIETDTITVSSNATLQDSLSVNNSISANTIELTSNATLVDATANNINANTITVTSNASLADVTAEDITANSILVESSLEVSNVVFETSTLEVDDNVGTQQTIVSFAVNTYHSAKITVTGRHTNSSVTEVQMTEVLAVTDGIDVFMTTFGTLSTDVNNDFSVFTLDADVDSGSGNVRIRGNSTNANTQITAVSQLFKI